LSPSFSSLSLFNSLFQFLYLSSDFFILFSFLFFSSRQIAFCLLLSLHLILKRVFLYPNFFISFSRRVFFFLLSAQNFSFHFKLFSFLKLFFSWNNYWSTWQSTINSQKKTKQNLGQKSKVVLAILDLRVPFSSFLLSPVFAISIKL
jgi:hypothetical protein